MHSALIPQQLRVEGGFQVTTVRHLSNSVPYSALVSSIAHWFPL